ncbi:hypothetical protein PVIIG_05442 [Plasmodium vivax India VII]|uniref:Uncharacterized protein n=1 Tax=Plasmodium vivax India VII TaxID=1077284 RepID=A0A0J9S4W2_PLAVI|nr:hypothetical protein PVIIG_05442 [Plasmodium vivax India VII]
MTENITDIDKWNDAYPYLDEIWNKYKEFDETVDNDPKQNDYFIVCYYIIGKLNGDTNEHEAFCKKLVRNLGHHSDNYDSRKYTTNRCLNLNNWIYNSMKKHNIRENIITKCFEEYKGIMEGRNQHPSCYYYEYDKTHAEPMKIIMLNIFESSIGTIKNILNGEKGRSNTCRKYVCETVQIYKDMYQKYCVNAEAGNKRHENTCSKLKGFEYSYTHFFRKDLIKENEVPSLNNIQNKYLTECHEYLQEQALDSAVVTQDQSIGSSRTLPQDSNLGGPESIPHPKGENPSGPMSSTVSTAIGTVAGASSILALLYKVTQNFILIYEKYCITLFII